MATLVTFKVRGDTAANWTSVNPVLADREIAVEKDTRKLKIGDGVTAWNALPYAGGSPRNGCMVRKAANQTALNATSVSVLTWDQEVYDDGGWHDNAVNNSRLIVPTGVTRVRVGVTITIANIDANVSVQSSLLKNGVAGFEGTARLGTTSTAGAARLSFVSGPVPVVTGDYFEVNLIVAADISIDITATTSNFWIEAA